MVIMDVLTTSYITIPNRKLWADLTLFLLLITLCKLYVVVKLYHKLIFVLIRFVLGVGFEGHNIVFVLIGAGGNFQSLADADHGSFVKIVRFDEFGKRNFIFAGNSTGCISSLDNIFLVSNLTGLVNVGGD